MEKVAPSERFRRELEEVLAGVDGEQDPVEVVGRLGARLILQQALEDEVTEFLGRRRYQRVGETVSHRNGHEPKTIKTTSGSLTVERPRVRDAGKLGFVSKIIGKGVARTHALESLVISSFLRGLSTRDVEAALEEVFEEPIASKSTVLDATACAGPGAAGSAAPTQRGRFSPQGLSGGSSERGR